MYVEQHWGTELGNRSGEQNRLACMPAALCLQLLHLHKYAAICRSVFYLPKPRPLNHLVQDLFGGPTLVLQGAKVIKNYY